MTVRTLDKIPFEELIECFLLAFENYYVKMPTELAYYQQRWQAAKVDYSLSYGMFQEERLVGFIIHAVDERFGERIAFNTGTGVIPAYRGKRIVQSIYEHATKDLLHNGIQKSKLEVITQNEKAIRAYQNVGFDIKKEYWCYAGKIETSSDSAVELKQLSLKTYDWSTLPNQQFYSWDFQKETVIEGNYELYHVLHNHIPESYFIINPSNTYLAQFDILSDDQPAWSRLFSAISHISEEVKMINVDKRLTDKLDHIQSAGLTNTINQYEMEMDLLSKDDNKCVYL